MKLYDLLDKDKLDAHLSNGMVAIQRHPTLPLRIYNYTNRAAFEPAWGDGTIDYCRGLIVDADDNIVARPFKKFHNFQTPSIPETLLENLPTDIPDITVKMDGSLGIWYPDGTQEGAIATRGSFTSPQALWATNWWKTCGAVNSLYTPWEDVWTPLFEIIYPENRIVVDYGNRKDLVVIGGVYIESGKEVSRRLLVGTFGNKVVKHFDVPDAYTLQQISEHNYPNEEGYVLTYANGLKIKIKFEDYKRLHRLITGVNPRVIWEMLRDDEWLDETNLPDNFRAWLHKWSDYLQGQFLDIIEAARIIFASRPIHVVHYPVEQSLKYHRAECARYFSASTEDKKHLLPVLFALLDGKNPAPIIWKQIEPAGNDQRFKYSVDAAAEAE